MAAGLLNLIVEQGATFRRVLEVRDSSGALLDLTGYTARMQARTRVPAADPPALDLDTATKGGLAVGGTAGTVTLTITTAQTTALPARLYAYDLELVEPGGDVIRLVEGSIQVTPEVTR